MAISGDSLSSSSVPPSNLLQSACQSASLRLRLVFLRLVFLRLGYRLPDPLLLLLAQRRDLVDQRSDLAHEVAQPLIDQLLEEEVLGQQEHRVVPGHRADDILP